jgi:hypothetical protein
MQITAYADVEYWTCPTCKAHSEYKPENSLGHKVEHVATAK